MSDDTKKLMVLITRGLDDERTIVAWTIANAGVASGQEVTIFLVSSGVDVVRKGAADLLRMNPLDPSLKELMTSFVEGGGTIWACPPCANLRGYKAEDLIDDVEIVGAGPVHALLMGGANTLCF